MRLRSIVLAGSALALSSLHAQPVQVGDPRKGDELVQSLMLARSMGYAEYTIAPGTYHLHNGFVLQGWKDTTIHAQGVVIVFEQVDQRPIRLEHCSHVTWDGGTYRFARPAFTQGKVLAIHNEGRDRVVVWQPDAGYPTNLDPKVKVFDIVDKKTRQLKMNTGDWPYSSIAPAAKGQFQIRLRPRSGDTDPVPGDWLVTRSPAGTKVFELVRCAACTIRGVTLQNAGFGAFFETNGPGANRYLGCTVEPGPRPPGATEDQLVACGADGFHSNQMEVGPDIEDCVWQGVFLDDCIAIHGKFDPLVKIEADGLVLSAAQGFVPRVGDELRIADKHGFWAVTTCAAVKRLPGQQVKLTLKPEVIPPLNEDELADPKGGTKVADPAFCGRGYKILRCTLGDTRSRGILVKGDDGLIEGCKIDNCGMSAISIGPEFGWNEAGYCANVTAKDNAITRCDRANLPGTAIWVHGDGATGNQAIKILHNTLTACLGPALIAVDDTEGAEVAGNRFVAVPTRRVANRPVTEHESGGLNEHDNSVLAR